MKLTLFSYFSKLLTGIALGAALLWTAPASATRIKDIGSFQGLRTNQLTGYGLVVGLAGTGDDNLEYATQGVKGTVSRFGLTLPPGVNPSLKNAAAVIVTAELPPFAKPGQRLDITVSALGKAKSLRGGTLVMMPLRGADGQIYAMAHRAIWRLAVWASRQPMAHARWSIFPALAAYPAAQQWSAASEPALPTHRI